MNITHKSPDIIDENNMISPMIESIAYSEHMMNRIDSGEMKIIEITTLLIVPTDKTINDIETNISYGDNTTVLQVLCEDINLEKA